MKSMANNMLLNTGSLYLFNAVLAPYIINDNESEILKTLKAAGLITAIEEGKAILQRAGYDIRLFK